MPGKGNSKDRWLISYADFITLLLAVFMLMYATAKAKEGHLSIPGLPNQGQSPAASTTPNPTLTPVPTSAPKPTPRQSNILSDLQNSLQLEQQKALLTVTADQRGIVISLDDRICFTPGSADVQSEAMPMFAKVGKVLSRYDSRILLQGHTDSTPIHNGLFSSNWELSTARSIAVMRLMQGNAPLHPERFLIGGSADNAPVSSNDTEGGRAHNRRVEIIVLDDVGPAGSFSAAAR